MTKNTVTKAQPSEMDQVMTELNELIGMDTVKRDVEELKALTRFRAARKTAGLSTGAQSMHLVFTGNPGTGKTTVARLIGRLYKEMGLLSKGHFVECDRGDLVAGYVGQTALKTQEVIKSAMGGVLFIDEAYSLYQGDGRDFGPEAIETILKAMEDHRDDLVVIVAGYPDLMKRFIDSNPGLQSRFNKYIDFPDYSGNELTSIYDMLSKQRGFETNGPARVEITKLLEEQKVTGGRNFGNGRTVRNLIEKLEMRVAARLDKSGALAEIEAAAGDPNTDSKQLASMRKRLMTVTVADVKGIQMEFIKNEKADAEQQQVKKNPIGFALNPAPSTADINRAKNAEKAAQAPRPRS